MTGQTISHYRIIDKLGEGGMGVVYKAEDEKLKRLVALKFLPSEHRDRFLREAQAAAALNHPNICTVYEVDEEHGFIAMEFIEGKSVSERIAQRPLKIDDALDISIQTAQGQAAHERGIVHRDIKPSNIMMTDFLLEHYRISSDGNRVVFAAIDEQGRSTVWLATLDGRSAPRRLSDMNATRVDFGADDTVYFLGEEAPRKFVFRVKEGGSNLEKPLTTPFSYFYQVAPDGKSIAGFEEFQVRVHTPGVPAVTACTVCGAAGGENRGITPPAISWSADGKYVYFNLRDAGTIYAAPLPSGKIFPNLGSVTK